MPTIRRAGAEDARFLQQMLAVAADWRDGGDVRSPELVMADPVLSRYLDRWNDAVDVGFVAVADERRPALGPVDPMIGATWWRFLSGAQAGYGFVDEATPEVSIGVGADHRGRGIGTLLLASLISEARRRGIPGLSLSVEADNPASRLYLELGFTVVGELDGSPTMLLRLRS